MKSGLNLHASIVLPVKHQFTEFLSAGNSGSSSSGNSGEDTSQAQMVGRALLRNELLHDSIDDIRVSRLR